MPVHDLGHQVPHLLRIGDIRPHGVDVLAGEAFRIGRQVRGDDPGAFLQEAARDGIADAGEPAGDDGDLAFETVPHAHFPPRKPIEIQGTAATRMVPSSSAPM